jgi:serine/threonine protein kinase
MDSERDLDLEALEKTIQGLEAHPLDATIDALTLAKQRANLSDISEALDISLPTLPVLSVDRGEDRGEERGGVGVGRGADLSVLDTLGEGGMGVVLRARQACLQREVAVKTLHPHRAYSPRDADNAQKLIDEAVLTGQLEHPNIIPVHVLGNDAHGQPLLVMKRVEGVSWRALIADPDSDFWPERGDARRVRHLEVMVQVCHAVAFAHSRGVIHRDIKPANVMVGRFGEVYLLDWGVATHLEALAPNQRQDPTQDKTKANAARPVLLGTPAYMAPEMALGQQQWVNERSDIYLLGATLFEVLTGKPPHQGASLMATLLQAHSTKRLTIENPDIPEALTKLVADATAHDLTERLPTVEAFRAALLDYLRNQGASLLAAQSLDELFVIAQSLADLDARAATRATTRTETSAATETDPVAVATERALQDRTTRALLRLNIALEQWPQNERARIGLQHHLERMLRRALSLNMAEQAQSFLTQLPYPNPALQAEVDALLAEQRRDLDARASLRALRHEQNLSVGYRVRMYTYGFFVAVATALNLFFLYRFDGDISRYGHAETNFAALGAGTLFAVFGLIFRRRVMETAINRRLTLGFGSAMGGVVLNRLYAWYALAPLSYMHAVDLLIFGVVQIAFAPGLHTLLAVAGTLCILAAASSAFFPATAGLAFTLSILLCPILILRAFAQTRSRQAR